MRVQNSPQDPCPICGKETTLAVIEPHPTHPERELHTYRCADCGPVKTTSHRQRDGILPRAA
jgi:uncharacterized Zn finger protein